MERTRLSNLSKNDRPSESSNGSSSQSHHDRCSDKASEPQKSLIPASENDIVGHQDRSKPLPEHSHGWKPHEGRRYHSSSSARHVEEGSKATKASRSVSMKDSLSHTKLEPMETTTEHGREDLRRICHEQDAIIRDQKRDYRILRERAGDVIAFHKKDARDATKEVSSLKKHLADITGKYEEGKQQTMAMRQQISGLQNDLVMAAKTEPHLLADDAIREKFRALCGRLDQWVRVNVRAGTLQPLQKLLPGTVDIVAAVCPHFQSMEVMKGNLCVASAHWIFRDALTGSWYPGLPEEGPLSALEQVENYMRWTNGRVDEWRSTTYSAIKSSPTNYIARASSDLCHGVARKVCEVLEDLTSVQTGPGSKFNELFSITQAALDLSQILYSQRARFQVGNCYVAYENLAFNPEEFERENADDPPSEHAQEAVGMITMPCLYKSGDNFNQQSSYTGVVCKGKALARAVAQRNSKGGVALS